MQELIKYFKKHPALMWIGVGLLAIGAYIIGKNIAGQSQSTSSQTVPPSTGTFNYNYYSGTPTQQAASTDTTVTTPATTTTDTSHPAGIIDTTSSPAGAISPVSSLNPIFSQFATTTDNPAAWTAQPLGATPGLSSSQEAQKQYQGCLDNCMATSVHCAGSKRGSAECIAWCQAKCAARHLS